MGVLRKSFSAPVSRSALSESLSPKATIPLNDSWCGTLYFHITISSDNHIISFFLSILSISLSQSYILTPFCLPSLLLLSPWRDELTQNSPKLSIEIGKKGECPKCSLHTVTSTFSAIFNFVAINVFSTKGLNNRLWEVLSAAITIHIGMSWRRPCSIIYFEMLHTRNVTTTSPRVH